MTDQSDEMMLDATAEEEDEEAKRGLPSLNSDMSPEEEQVVQQMATVDTLSDKYNGKCGRVVDVRYDDEVDTPEEFRQAVQELGRKQQQAQSANLVDSDVSEELVEAQDQLRKMMGVDANEKRTILVTVQLPDGRTFTESFEEPTFMSPEVDNEWAKLYMDVLDLDPQREESVVGKPVPVKETNSRVNEYSIDLDRGESVDPDEEMTEPTALERAVGLAKASADPSSEVFPVVWLALFMLIAGGIAFAASTGLIG